MAEPTSAAPLLTMRKTTSRKPKNAATISDLEMTWLPVQPPLAGEIVEDDDRGLSAIAVELETGGGDDPIPLMCGIPNNHARSADSHPPPAAARPF
jgi:hypothetical protein